MKNIAIVAVLLSTVALAGCQTAKDRLAVFFGTSDPCAQGEAVYAGWLTFAATRNDIPAEIRARADAAHAAFVAQCSDGDISQVTLQKALRAYTAALQSYENSIRAK